MVDVSNSKGGTVLVSIQPVSSDLLPPQPNIEEGWDIVAEDGGAQTDEPTTPRAERKEIQDKEKEDHYGFIVRPGDDQLHYDATDDAKKVREREQKWLKMITNWKDWSDNKSTRLKERCRKGIPDSLRGRAWMLLSGANELMEQNAGVFEELVSREDNDVVIHVIDKDLARTFPSHVLFAEKGSQGQRDLRLVLKAYAFYNEKTGYCQAMAPVAATLLMHMPANQAFWCLVQICEQYLPGYYSPGLHAFQIDALILKDLLAKQLPVVAQFLDSKLPPTNPNEVHKGLDPVLYCTEWFMSIFSRSLPWRSVLRVWDMFFFEGVKVLFKVALAIMSLSFSKPKQREECPGFFEVTQKLRNLPLSVTHEGILLPEILRFPIHNQELKKFHFQQADVHFSEERARIMEMQARRSQARKSFSTLSEATSEGPD
ncbi:PREDICTED: TBC1 domain family member 10A-like [Amphimedon queenslandica]|uniref:Rab-GAP TBC domain-containing protein n=1 Tax=Amphimedon queenslandica TaxID=400682 RepID=A0A1X7U5P9_AMPQE|nr:PREDICTED: TBC1 domain family member 10A-like [Amphimedon queenslandica]|eukprot:XP_003388923.1 PREDICTED: TBC1 domain family member 10A-like [Amphimedon queenslandica]